MRPLRLLLLSAIGLTFTATAAIADDWTAVRLRGQVVELVNGTWQPVHRNDVVPDETVIRTLANGYVDFTRGTETVSLQPTTQVQIFDKGGAKPFTTVQQAFGTVAVEAEVGKRPALRGRDALSRRRGQGHQIHRDVRQDRRQRVGAARPRRGRRQSQQDAHHHNRRTERQRQRGVRRSPGSAGRVGRQRPR